MVNNLYSYLTNTAWPECPGQSFGNKYWNHTSDPRLFQLAVNIVEYVRAKESKQKIVSAIRGHVNGTAPNYSFVSDTVARDSAWGIFPSGVAMPIMGITRTPYFTQMNMNYVSFGAPALRTSNGWHNSTCRRMAGSIR
ncbi:MAG: hypothetical protein WDO13_01775 [Verrucomicrobiota bacterium]